MKEEDIFKEEFPILYTENFILREIKFDAYKAF